MLDEVPRGWRMAALGSLLAPISREARVDGTRVYSLLGVRWYCDGARNHSTVDGSTLQAPSLNQVRAGDITYNKMWVTKAAFAIVGPELDGLWATNEYPTFRADVQLIDNRYLWSVMQTPDFQSAASALCRGSTSRARLHPADFLRITIPVPPLPEQKKIAAILSSVDEAIQATQAVIDQTRRVKEGLLQDLLTRGIGHTRFKQTEIGQIPEGWDLVPAYSVCEAVIDCKNRTPPETSHGFAVVRTPNIRDGRFVLDGLKFTDFASYEVWTQRGKPRPGDVLITREAPVGEVALLPASIGPACLGQRMMMYRPGRRLNNEFLLAALLSPQIRNHLLKLAGGSTVGHVRVDDIRTLPIPVPPLPEQLQIAGVVRAAANAVACEEAELVALLASKSGLLQDLLTGKVRVRP